MESPLPQPDPAPPAAVVTPTPDDGTRLTGILPWDEASRPTYPVRPDPAEQAAYGRPSWRCRGTSRRCTTTCGPS